MNIKEKLLNMSEEIKSEVIQTRRYLHEHPELSFQETETSKYIFEKLSYLEGLEISHPTKTSIMAKLNSGREGKTIAIRADIDALPIHEETELEFKSKNPGVMHACGHDGHTAMVLGVAKILNNFRNEINGEIRFIFQHGEELLPGGAIDLIDAGVLEDVDLIIGSHLWTQFETGKLFTTPGPFMASADIFEIEIIGDGGHSAVPHITIDALSIGNQLINNLMNIRSNNIDPFENVVISVTKFQSGSSHSIIPGTAKIVGSARTFNNKLRDQIAVDIERMIKGVVQAYGADYKLNFIRGYNPLINEEKTTEVMIKTISEIYGENSLLEGNPLMISEDFSAYQEIVPGCFFMIGAGNSKEGLNYPHHHPLFNFDEKSMDIGVKVFLNAVYNFMFD